MLHTQRPNKRSSFLSPHSCLRFPLLPTAADDSKQQQQQQQQQKLAKSSSLVSGAAAAVGGLLKPWLGGGSK